MNAVNTSETMALLKSALSAQNGRPDLAKAFTQSATAFAGLTAYSLEAPAKTLYPVITPLRNMIPRQTVTGTGIQANWRAITGINTTKVPAGIAEGQRGGVITTQVKEYLAAFRGLGLDDTVTFEAELAGQGFDDVKARAVEGLLRSLMIQEEGVILGGFGAGTVLGTTPTPTLTPGAASTGVIGNATSVSVICVALTPRGLYYANASDLTVGILPTITVTRPDGSTLTANGGCAQKSAAAAVSTTSANSSMQASVAPVRGAAAYAWYAGAGGSERLHAITTINSTVITSIAALASNQTAASIPAADRSDDSLIFDGLLGMCAKSILGAYWKALGTGTPGTGTGLTADGAGGIVEWDEALKWFWDTNRLSPTNIWVSSQEMNFIRKKILTGSATAAQRFTLTTAQQAVLGGVMVGAYTNPFAMGGAKTIPIEIHPDLPPGTMLFTTSTLPYTLSGVTDVMRVLCRRDYYQIEWPLQRRQYEYGVYTDEVLQHYFPASMGVITNIAPS